MRKSNARHPWRQPGPGARAVDPIAQSRSTQFAAYLETLPRAERQQVELAERAFVWRAEAATSPQQSAVRDYARGMLGVKESEPAAYRGFVV